MKISDILDKKGIKIGKVVNVTQDRFSELGAEDGDKILSLKEMKLRGEDGSR